MTEDKDIRARQGRLIEVLEAYGADPARWPAGDRRDLRGLLAAPRPAWLERQLAEARATDRLLDEAPSPPLPPDLAERIASAAGEVPQHGSGAILHIAAYRALPIQAGRLPAWGTAAALAASLIVGLYLGASGVVGELDLGESMAAALGGADDAGVIGLIDPTGLMEDTLL